MESENQSVNKRSTRFKSMLENTMSSLPDNPEHARIEDAHQLQGSKRKADINLSKHHGIKRFALGNLTNAESDNMLQKPQKASNSMAKAKQSIDLKVPGTKNKGVTKIFTRAAMRLEKALSNGKKLQGKPEKQGDANDNENMQPSALSEDFAKINVGYGAASKPEMVPSAPGIVRCTKLGSTKTKQLSSAQLPVVQLGEKNVKILGGADMKQTGRLSNEFEQSDNSLYLSAIEVDDVDTISSTAYGTDKVIGKGARINVMPKPQAPPPLLMKRKNVIEKAIDPKCSTVQEKMIIPWNLPVCSNSKNQIIEVTNDNNQKKSLDEKIDLKPKKQTSSESELSNDALYVTAIDNLDEEGSSSSARILEPTPVEQDNIIINTQPIAERNVIQNEGLEKDDKRGCDDAEQPRSPRKRTPPGVEDFDMFYWHDINQVSEYAQDIFDYLRERENVYVLKDYMKSQPHLSHYMRALLVDWMVEIQESFELNHETLYLAVKIVDAYLSLVVIGRDTLQLVAAAALLIAAKYDERVPPTVDDFIYICDGAYERHELLKMERTVFRAIGFDLGFPLSYRFLRRYARVARIPMPILTLARYILESSLMEYATVVLTDSKLACAALFIALRMSNQRGWNKTLEYYTGYKVNDFKDIAILLNSGILPRTSLLYKLTNVRDKYSHDLFFQVAKRPVITTWEQLFDTTDVLFKVPASVAPSTSNASTTKDIETVSA